jgi:tetratricopeptide (TPR) repeat protein
MYHHSCGDDGDDYTVLSQVGVFLMSRTCFVISPIGEEGSPVRQLADDLLELIIEPALESFDFVVTRADRIVSSGIITAEIIEYVQSADLCIIDLTGNNANVFYECGRRHETAKPFLQVIRKNEQLPFDVSGIRTLFYDLTDARAVRTTIEEMRKYVQVVSVNSASTPRSATSVTSLAESVDRLERKLDKLIAGSTIRQAQLPGDDASLSEESMPLFRGRRRPYEEFMSAVATGNQAGAEAALETLVAQRGSTDETVYMMASLLAGRAGSARGAAVLFDNLDALPLEAVEGDQSGDAAESAKGPDRVKTLLTLKDYFIATDNATEGYGRLLQPISEAVGVLEGQEAKSERAGELCNAVQMLAYSARKSAEAIEWGEKAVKLSPSVASYRTNLAMNYERADRIGEAKNLVDSALAISPDSSHAISEAIDIYKKLHDDARVSEFMDKLRQVNPQQYAVKRILLQQSSRPDSR